RPREPPATQRTHTRTREHSGARAPGAGGGPYRSSQTRTPLSTMPPARARLAPAFEAVPTSTGRGAVGSIVRVPPQGSAWLSCHPPSRDSPLRSRSPRFVCARHSRARYRRSPPQPPCGVARYGRDRLLKKVRRGASNVFVGSARHGLVNVPPPNLATVRPARIYCTWQPARSRCGWRTTAAHRTPPSPEELPATVDVLDAGMRRAGVSALGAARRLPAGQRAGRG